MNTKILIFERTVLWFLFLNALLVCTKSIADPGDTDIRPTRNNAECIISFAKDDSNIRSTRIFCSLLKKHKIKGVITECMITGSVGNWQNRGTWEEWLDLYNEGYLDLANHTVTHPFIIIDLPEDSIYYEVVNAKTTLEERFPGLDVMFVVSPRANRDKVVDQIFEETHYSAKWGGSHVGFNSLSPSVFEWNHLLQKQAFH
ncbi:polysaccharide deacetylase family protein, partial [Bacteroidota bacterium]